MRLAMRNLVIGMAVCGLAGTAVAAKKDKGLIVPLKTSAGADAGTATFKQEKGDKLVIKVSLMGLQSGEHAVHIHQKPLCDAPDFKTAGGHFNPDMKQHGTMNPAGHHNGDLPQNISVGPDGKGQATFTVKYLSMGTGTANDILANGGTSIMVHEKADDMKTDPTGNAGNRVACGVIIEGPPTK